jgi:hypothetical protein
MALVIPPDQRDYRDASDGDSDRHHRRESDRLAKSDEANPTKATTIDNDNVHSGRIGRAMAGASRCIQDEAPSVHDGGSLAGNEPASVASTSVSYSARLSA